MRTRRWRTGLAGVLVGAVALGVAACSADGDQPKATGPSAEVPSQVTVAVYGPDAVTTAYSKIAARFSADHPEVSVNVKPYASRAQAMADLERTRGTSRAPDIFLADDGDLDQLRRERLSRPVNDLLTQRNVDLGDNYQRVGIEDFSEDNALQCMPIEVSPTVVYYNTNLVRLSALRPAGVQAPNADAGWRFNDFVTAVQQASARGGGVRGFAADGTIAQLAPFLFSGGSTVVDDVEDPTRLELSESEGLDAMQRLLPVLRNTSQTFTPAQVSSTSQVQRFKAGKLAMMLGQRDLSPELTAQKGLSFGVMPVPRLGSTATTGTTTGLCVSPQVKSGTPEDEAVGDLLAYLVGDSASETLAATGYVVPANLTALNSDSFTQAGSGPLGGDTVFANSVRFINKLPGSQTFEAALAAADATFRPLLKESVSGPLDEDRLQERLAQVDQASQRVLDPDSLTPSTTSTSPASPSPTSTPSISPTGN